MAWSFAYRSSVMRSAPDSRAFLRSSLGDTSFGMQYINLKTASGYFSAISWCATLTTKSRYILKMDGDSRAPCRHPTRVSNIRPFPLMHAFVPVYGTRRIATICGHLRWGFTWKKRTFCIACSNHSFNPNHNKLYITGKLILQRFWKRMFLCTASKSNLVPGCQRHYPQCKTLGYLRKDFSLQTSQTNKLMLFQRIVPNCWYEWRILQNCKITCQKSHLKLNHQNVGDFSLIIFSPASPWQIPSFISIHLMSTNSPENFRSIA